MPQRGKCLIVLLVGVHLCLQLWAFAHATWAGARYNTSCTQTRARTHTHTRARAHTHTHTQTTSKKQATERQQPLDIMREAVYRRVWVVGSPCNPSKLFVTRPPFYSDLGALQQLVLKISRNFGILKRLTQTHTHTA